MHKRLWGSISRRNSDISEKAVPDGDSPEATVARGVRLFCESGGPNNTGDEVLHLPTVVEAAESSPAAAGQAAVAIRKFLSAKNHQRAYVQYNAIMLVRILADNPGKSFTRNLDARFVGTVKELLREGRDMSVQQILRETLDSFETRKPEDETLAGLREMWRKEKVKQDKRAGLQVRVPHHPSPFLCKTLGQFADGDQSNHKPGVRPNGPQNYQQQVTQQQNYFARHNNNNNNNINNNHHQNRAPRSLPAPAELSQRVEEARTSAKLLSQLVQTTPPAEVPGNELIKEFVERCQSASRSMQTYIHSDAPAPDEDTLLTLIETNDQLATAMSRHQRALLQARRLTGAAAGGLAGQGGLQQHGGLFAASAPAPPPQSASGGHLNGVGVLPTTAGGGGGGYAPPQPPPNQRFPEQSGGDQTNPFGDHNEARDQAVVGSSSQAATAPPMQMEYGLPPAGVTVPEAGGLDGGPSSRGLDEQPRKPRYRF